MYKIVVKALAVFLPVLWVSTSLYSQTYDRPRTVLTAEVFAYGSTFNAPSPPLAEFGLRSPNPKVSFVGGVVGWSDLSFIRIGYIPAGDSPEMFYIDTGAQIITSTQSHDINQLHGANRIVFELSVGVLGEIVAPQMSLEYGGDFYLFGGAVGNKWLVRRVLDFTQCLGRDIEWEITLLMHANDNVSRFGRTSFSIQATGAECESSAFDKSLKRGRK